MEVLTGEVAALMEWVNDPTRIIIAHLAKNVITDDIEAIALTDLVECNFAGYEPVRVENWIPRLFDDDAYGEVVSGELEWELDVDAVAQKVSCCYLTIQEPGHDVALFWAIPLTPNRKVNKDTRFFTFEFRLSSTNLDDVTDVEMVV